MTVLHSAPATAIVNENRLVSWKFNSVPFVLWQSHAQLQQLSRAITMQYYQSAQYYCHDDTSCLRSAWRQLSDLEVADGELPDNETAMIQVWRYAPVFADSSRVDNLSLALSLAAIDDERIQLEVDRMFGKEYPWQEAL